MTFSELRTRADKLAEMWGFLNSSQTPDWSTLVNQAYRDICWRTEVIRGPLVSISSVSGQAEYTLTSPSWKDVLDCLYNGNALKAANENQLRRTVPTYLVTANGTPTHYWLPRPNTLRLWPTPDTSTTDVIKVYGIRAPAALSADGDNPVITEVYHEAIALYAAFLHCKQFAKGEARAVLGERLAEYESFVQALKLEQIQNSGMDAYRMVSPVSPDTVEV